MIACSSVDAEAGQPSQPPSIRSRATPASSADQLDAATVGLHVRPHALERLAHARLEVDRVVAVQQHQAGHHPVLGQLRALGVVEHGEDPVQAFAVHLHQLGDERLDPRVADRVEARAQVGGESFRAHASAVGVCNTFRTLPLPVYMCTPHGRQGSNECTARMMSTPLKLSGPFSSKIGVFWTASSYGPGVP